eukprot:1157406-Pelagomonas_calceolata.AAC.3
MRRLDSARLLSAICYCAQKGQCNKGVVVLSVLSGLRLGGAVIRLELTCGGDLQHWHGLPAEEILPTSVKEKDAHWLRRAVSLLHLKATGSGSAEGDLKGYWKYPAPGPG